MRRQTHPNPSPVRAKLRKDQMRKFEDFIDHLTKLDFQPKTVIDAGVAWGTPELYKAFPEAYFILIEALPIFEKNCRDILKKVSGESHIKAVSDYEGQTTFTLDPEPIRKAGFSISSEKKDGALEQVVVITTLDKLLEDRNLERPLLLKTDLQGHDLPAIKGGLSMLRQSDMVIMETSMFNKQNLLSDVILFMTEQGFELYDVFGQLSRPYDNASGQFDAAFVPKGSPFRAQVKWM